MSVRGARSVQSKKAATREAWTKPRIVKELRQRKRKGESLGHRALGVANRALLSAALHHFGTYQKALAAAKIDYAAVSGRPVWTKDRIIKTIKLARKRHRDLSWSAVMQEDDSLRKAAFAAIRLRAFGSWPRALQAAGVDGDDYRRYRAWDETAVAFDLKQRHANDEPNNSAAVQAEDPGLHAAAVRYFGSFDRALRAARLEPRKVRLPQGEGPLTLLRMTTCRVLSP